MNRAPRAAVLLTGTFYVEEVPALDVRAEGDVVGIEKLAPKNRIK